MIPVRYATVNVQIRRAHRGHRDAGTRTTSRRTTRALTPPAGWHRVNLRRSRHSFRRFSHSAAPRTAKPGEGSQVSLVKYGREQTALGQSSLQAIAQHLLCLMTRNMSSDGFVFTDPLAPEGFSAPGCIIAAPLFPAACQQRLWPPVPQATADAITWLGNALQEHWNGTYYASVLSIQPPRNGYDPNIDIVMAGVYGAVPYTDTKLLAQLRSFVASGQTARLPRPARSTPPARAAGSGRTLLRTREYRQPGPVGAFR